jgi:hypothetical protein
MFWDMTGATMIEYIYLFKNNDWFVSKSSYIKKNLLPKDAYDLGLCYWSKPENLNLKKFKKELSYEPKMTEKDMIGKIGSMLKKSFDADNIQVQGGKLPSGKEVN